MPQRWVQPKQIEELDRIVIGKLMKNLEHTNSELCENLDTQGIKLTAKLRGVNVRELKRVLGSHEPLSKWKPALGKIHAVTVNLSHWRNEAKQFADTLWWHRAATKHYRKHVQVDWARRSAAIKEQVSRLKSKEG